MHPNHLAVAKHPIPRVLGSSLTAVALSAWKYSACDVEADCVCLANPAVHWRNEKRPALPICVTDSKRRRADQQVFFASTYSDNVNKAINVGFGFFRDSFGFSL